MLAFCSWKRCPSRSEPFMYLSTHLITHPSSLAWRDLVVKSFTQSSKHRWTRLEYICQQKELAIWSFEKVWWSKLSIWQFSLHGSRCITNIHEFLHLLLLHARLQLALLLLIQPKGMRIQRILHKMVHETWNRKRELELTHPYVQASPIAVKGRYVDMTFQATNKYKYEQNTYYLATTTTATTTSSRGERAHRYARPLYSGRNTLAKPLTSSFTTHHPLPSF